MVTQRKSPKSKKRRELFSAPGYCPLGPIRRIERTYSRRRKQEALLFLVHYRIPMQINYTGRYIRPSTVFPRKTRTIHCGTPKLNRATPLFLFSKRNLGMTRIP
jgi:hypothetical protein